MMSRAAKSFSISRRSSSSSTKSIRPRPFSRAISHRSNARPRSVRLGRAPFGWEVAQRAFWARLQISTEQKPSISKNLWFQCQAFPKNVLGFLWDFKGLWTSKSKNMPLPNFCAPGRPKPFARARFRIAGCGSRSTLARFCFSEREISIGDLASKRPPCHGVGVAEGG